MTLAEGLVILGCRESSRNRKTELTVLERDVTKLESVKGPFPGCRTTKRPRDAEKKGLPFEWGGDFGCRRLENRALGRIDRPISFTASRRRSRRST